MGALMLIAVVIVAVSGIAMIVAQMQKSEMERQSNIDAVEKENLRIMSIQPLINPSTMLLDQLNVTVANLNSKDSRIASVMINGRNAQNWSSTDDYNNETMFSYYGRLRIPAGKNKVISLNFPGDFDGCYNVSASDSLKIEVLSENSNIFSKIYQPPTPVIKTSIETENLGIAERDILVLDGSDSFDDGSIVSYEWNICAEETTTTTSTSFGATTTTTSTTTTTTSLGATTTTTTSSTTTTTCFYITTGKKVRAYLNSTGPFYVTLKLTDDTNMIGISPEPIKIPEDKNFNPAVRLIAAYNVTAPNILEATLKDIEGNNVSGVGVSFISISGNATYFPSGGVTNSSGQVWTNVTSGSGVVQVRSGKMNPIDVAVS